MLLTLLLSCDPAPPAAGPAAVETPATTDAAAEPAAAPDSRRATVQPAPGWGALLSDGETWFRTGGGDVGAGATKTMQLAPTGSTGVCGEVIADPQGAMVALPQGLPAPEITPAPAIQAALVERAAWRLDELLPDADRFAPAPTSPDPSRARGVVVGSVAKARRRGAPPVLVASGHRECIGVIAVLDGDAGTTLAYDLVQDACQPLRVLPPNDLDGDGVREVVAWSRQRAALYSMVETPGSVSLVRLGDWTCP